MKIEELSIGDWVFHLAEMQAGRISHIHRIGGIYSIGLDCADCIVVCGINDIAPIAITPEILEKNGWSEFSDYHNSWKLDIASDKRVWMFKNSHDWTFQVMSWGLSHNHSVAKAYIKHIHELQHALRLAGEEKEIEL